MTSAGTAVAQITGFQSGSFHFAFELFVRYSSTVDRLVSCTTLHSTSTVRVREYFVQETTSRYHWVIGCRRAVFAIRHISRWHVMNSTSRGMRRFARMPAAARFQ